MSDELIITHCAPTLAGLKTGSLFSCACPSQAAMTHAVRSWNRRLKQKGLRMLPLRYRSGRALIYLFRISALARDLREPAVSNLLHKQGYASCKPQQCIHTLIRRLQDVAEFPHEIGLFLGYPPEDVSGFIENRADCCKCSGCWKVYGDAEAAKCTFRQYKLCTSTYRRMHARGNSVERLAVSG